MLLRVILALVATGLGACSSGHSAPGDAGRDADAARDARADAGRDTGVDARADARPDALAEAGSDAGVDGGLDSDWLGCDPGWTPMPGLDPDLTTYYATNPSCLLPIAWESCGPGCQRLVDDPRFQRSITPGMGWTDGDRHLFTVVEGNAGLPTLEANRITVVASAEGEVFGAWRGSASGDRTKITGAGSVGGGNGWVGFEMSASRFTPEGNFATYDERLYHAPLSALSGPLDPILRLAPPVVSVSDIPQFVVASDTTLAAEVQPRAEVLVVEHGVAHWLGGRGSATPATPQQVMVQGHDVYWMDFFESYPGVRLAHGTWSTESEVFYDIPGVDLVGFATDGHDFAWVQGYDYGAGGYSHMELWTAPYTNDKSALAPRKVTDAYDGGNVGRLRDGVFATMGPSRNLEVYMLADGEKREWRIPDGMAIDGSVLWVTADEVAYPGRMSIRGQRTVIRLSIADAFTPVP